MLIARPSALLFSCGSTGDAFFSTNTAWLHFRRESFGRRILQNVEFTESLKAEHHSAEIKWFIFWGYLSFGKVIKILNAFLLGFIQVKLGFLSDGSILQLWPVPFSILSWCCVCMPCLQNTCSVFSSIFDNLIAQKTDCQLCLLGRHWKSVQHSRGTCW